MHFIHLVHLVAFGFSSLPKDLDSTHRLIEIISLLIVILMMTPPPGGGGIRLCHPQYIGIFTRAQQGHAQRLLVPQDGLKYQSCIVKEATKVVAAKPQPVERFQLANECEAWEPGIRWVGVDNIFYHVPSGGCDISRVARPRRLPCRVRASGKTKRFSGVVVFCKNQSMVGLAPVVPGNRTGQSKRIAVTTKARRKRFSCRLDCTKNQDFESGWRMTIMCGFV